MFCSSKLFVLFGERWLKGLIALVFLSFFIPSYPWTCKHFLLHPETMVLLLIAQKINNETLKAFNKTRFRRQFVPLVNTYYLTQFRKGRERESGLRGIQASLPVSTVSSVQASVHQVISDNRRLGTRARGHRGRGETLDNGHPLIRWLERLNVFLMGLLKSLRLCSLDIMLP